MITVKKLIEELQKEENKFVEVWVYNSGFKKDAHLEIDKVTRTGNKILIWTK